MSFDTEKLPGKAVAELYKKSLVELRNSEAGDELDIPFLGSNRKKILILVNYQSPEFIPDPDLLLLSGILTACKLTVDDVALINLNNISNRNHRDLVKTFGPTVVILFGLNSDAIELPIHFPNFQIQSYNKISFLSSPELSILDSDKLLKSKLWLCLKQVFSL
jgi:hypothetical protein